MVDVQGILAHRSVFWIALVSALLYASSPWILSPLTGLPSYTIGPLVTAIILLAVHAVCVSREFDDYAEYTSIRLFWVQHNLDHEMITEMEWFSAAMLLSSFELETTIDAVAAGKESPTETTMALIVGSDFFSHQVDELAASGVAHLANTKKTEDYNYLMNLFKTMTVVKIMTEEE
jgi:hypothetical protein